MARGAAVAHPSYGYMYFIPFDSQRVYCYKLDVEQWSELPLCPHRNPGLTVIDDVTVIGGKEVQGDDRYTTALFSWNGRKWEGTTFPPMKTARSQPAVVRAGSHIVVAGGHVGGNRTWTTAVEVLTLNSLMWATVSSLPKPLSSITATVCSDHVYVMDCNGAIYSSSLHCLTSSIHPITGARYVKTNQTVWCAEPNAPERESTLADLSGRLISVGGVTGITINSGVYQLCGREWMKIGIMSVARSECLVAVLEGKVVVLGGFDPIMYGFPTAAVEIGINTF